MANKMSKSLGNIIDPLQVIDGCTLESLQSTLLASNLSEKEIKKGLASKKSQFPNGIPPWGSDALRLCLLSYMIQPRSINVDLNVIISHRLFNNKLWNTAKYVLSQFSETELISLNFDVKKLSLLDKWVLVKLDRWAKAWNETLENYDFGKFVKSFQFLGDFWDVYIEVSKRQIRDGVHEEWKRMLLLWLDHILKLMAPVMPFITEEIYQHCNILPKEKYESLCIAKYPKSIELEGIEQEQVLTDTEFLLMISKEIRSNLGQLSIGRNKTIKAYLNSGSNYDLLMENKYVVETLTNWEIEVLKNSADGVMLDFPVVLDNGYFSFVQLDIKREIDVKEEISKLQNSVDKLIKYKEGISQKLGFPYIVEKAPAEVIEEMKNKLSNTQEKIETMENSIKKLKSMNKG
jgi:valyl-tRNA synthetase